MTKELLSTVDLSRPIPEMGAPSFAHFAKGGKPYCRRDGKLTEQERFWVEQRFSAAIKSQGKTGFSRRGKV